MAEKYIFTGSADGAFTTEDNRQQVYCNMYVISQLGEARDNYVPRGWKAEKFKCADTSVYKELVPGEEIELFFDSRQRVSFAKTTGRVMDLSVS